MALTDAQICNLALGRIGHKEFIDSLDDDTQAADCCEAAFSPCLLELLEASDWGFARKHASLAVVSGVTRSGWGYVYALPADCLVARYVFNGLRPGASVGWSGAAREYALANGAAISALSGASPAEPFDIEVSDDGETRYLLCDVATAELVYTRNAVSSAAFSQAFIQTLAWRIASELALSLPVKRDLHENAEKQWRARLLAAKAQNLREKQADPNPESQFITTRGG